MKEKIIIIGGGVSGVTTALTLQLLGYETEIYTAKIADQITNKNAHPEFASLFPSASVIPHSFYSGQLNELFQISQSFFYELRKKIFPGLTTHKHFEVFEFEPEDPGYKNRMLNYHPIEELPPREVPHRRPSQDLYGWTFNCIFADWPLYFPALLSFYNRSGGKIIRRKLTADDLPSLPADIIVNCSGTGSPDLFDDPVEKQLILRGHLLHKQGAPLITDSNNEIISYNYTPRPSTYADSSGKACDVYCYPRKDGWIIGGSRQPGFLDNNSWKPIEKNKFPTTEIDGYDIPAAIVDLNDEILHATFGQSLDQSDKLSALVGYRYLRSPEKGLRLDYETIYNKKVYHNYGHGGAGVTLSWGCAVNIAHMIASQQPSQITTLLLNRIDLNV